MRVSPPALSFAQMLLLSVSVRSSLMVAVRMRVGVRVMVMSPAAVVAEVMLLLLQEVVLMVLEIALLLVGLFSYGCCSCCCGCCCCCARRAPSAASIDVASLAFADNFVVAVVADVVVVVVLAFRSLGEKASVSSRAFESSGGSLEAWKESCFLGFGAENAAAWRKPVANLAGNVVLAAKEPFSQVYIERWKDIERMRRKEVQEREGETREKWAFSEGAIWRSICTAFGEVANAHARNVLSPRDGAPLGACMLFSWRGINEESCGKFRPRPRPRRSPQLPREII